MTPWEHIASLIGLSGGVVTVVLGLIAKFGKLVPLVEKAIAVLDGGSVTVQQIAGVAEKADPGLEQQVNTELARIQQAAADEVAKVVAEVRAKYAEILKAQPELAGVVKLAGKEVPILASGLASAEGLAKVAVPDEPAPVVSKSAPTSGFTVSTPPGVPTS